MAAVLIGAGPVSGCAATAICPAFVDVPDGALDAPPDAGTGGLPPFAVLLDEEAAPSTGTRSQLADGPGFTSGAVASKDGLLPGFSAEDTLCSSRCANMVGRAAPARETAALCVIGAGTEGELTPLAACDDPGAKAKRIEAVTIRLNLELALT
jgi:hypothetical protein